MWEIRVNAIDGDHHLAWKKTYDEAWQFACEWLSIPMKYGDIKEVSMYGDVLYIEAPEEV